MTIKRQGNFKKKNPIYAFINRLANNLNESYNTVYYLNNNNTHFLCIENIIVIHFIN